MHTRPLVRLVAALLPLAGAPVSAQSPGGLTPEQGWAAIGQCAANADERARHACVDDVLRRAGLLTPQAEARQRRQQFGLDENSTRAAAPPAPPKPATATAPSAPAATVAPAAAKVDANERVEVAVAKAVLANDGKVLLTTADGAVWKQTDSTTVPRLPDAGDTVKIRKASLGSYLCQMPTNHTFRCVRRK